MKDTNKSENPKFGGKWTKQKLDAVEKYLKAFTTALKGKFDDLVYIDLFAGTGFSETDNIMYPLTGSAMRALQVNPPFDRFVFAEKDENNCKELKKNVDKFTASATVETHQKDANYVMSKLNITHTNCRGVVFLDPYAAEVEYSTVEKISELKCLDLWMLFPTHAVTRMLSLDRERATEKKLTKVYGNNSWENLYNKYQATLDNDDIRLREKGTSEFVQLFKKQLEKTFGERLLNKSLSLKSSTDSPLFELIFCTGNPMGITLSHKIAKHIIEYRTKNSSQKTMGEYI